MVAPIIDPGPPADVVEDAPKDAPNEAAASVHTGSMVALMPANPESLTVENGDRSESLHVTIRFMGEADALSAPQRMAITDEVEAVAAGTGPIEATVSGIVIMGSDDSGQPATALLLESQELMELCEELCDELDATIPDASEHAEGSNWIAHLTLGYGLDPNAEDVRALVGTTLTLDRLAVHFADEITEYPLVAPEDDVLDDITESDIGAAVDAEMALMTAGEFKKYGKYATWDECVAAYSPSKGDAHAYCAEIKRRVLRNKAMPGKANKARKSVPGLTVALVAAGTPQDDMTVDEETGEWNGIITVEGVPSGDGRMIQPEALTWRTLPLPTMSMFKNPDSGASGHAGAELSGRMDWIERRPGANAGTFNLWAGGVLDLESEAGRETARLMAGRFLRGVSVDLDSLIAESENEISNIGPDTPIEEILSFDPGMLLIVEGRVAGITFTVFPAIQEATVQLGRGEPIMDDALVASIGPMREGVQGRTWMPLNVEAGALVASGSVETGFPVDPPAAWFEPMKFSGPTPIRVTTEGRVYGHAADRRGCHVGFLDRCVPPPMGDGQYRYFQNKATLTDVGTQVATGPLTTKTVHPDLAWNASDAMAWYHHTGSAVADIHVYNDEWGVAIAGAMRPTATRADARDVRGSDISPDWRPIQGEREAQAIAFLSVNASGYITPALVASAGPGWVQPGRIRARVDGEGEVLAMVGAASIRQSSNTSLAEVMEELAAFRSEMAKFRDEVRPFRVQRVMARAVEVGALSNGSGAKP